MKKLTIIFLFFVITKNDVISQDSLNTISLTDNVVYANSSFSSFRFITIVNFGGNNVTIDFQHEAACLYNLGNQNILVIDRSSYRKDRAFILYVCDANVEIYNIDNLLRRGSIHGLDNIKYQVLLDGSKISFKIKHDIYDGWKFERQDNYDVNYTINYLLNKIKNVNPKKITLGNPIGITDIYPFESYPQ